MAQRARGVRSTQARYGGLAPDMVGRVISAWQREWPDLDFSPIAVIGRLIRVASLVESELEGTLRQFGLNRASFDTLTALRRAGPPYRLSATRLADECMRTSSTLTTRTARLAEAGLITREPDPQDARSILVTLTSHGKAVVDAAAPPYLAAEEDLLTGLEDIQREQLANLLQLLLLSLERQDDASGDAGQVVPKLGLRVEPPHVALRKRRSVALPDQIGLLTCTVDPEGPGAQAGLTVGDLITAVDGHQYRSAAVLNQALAISSKRTVVATVVRGNEELRLKVSRLDG